MPVNLNACRPEDLRPIKGVRLGGAAAAIKRWDRRDVLLIALDEGCQVAGVFTQNRFAAAPVQVCREHLAGPDPIRALIINAGNANCGTGDAGLSASRRSCQAVAQALGIRATQVLPFSTGVILEPLPVERIEAAIGPCIDDLRENAWGEAARTIMTTDTVPKGASAQFQTTHGPVAVTGIAKGVGMLQPKMATMLAYVATDAAIGPSLMPSLVREVADASFNRVTVDGDTSTNDSFVLVASGRAGNTSIDSADHPDYPALRAAILQVCVQLAQAIARDGEGATKFVTIDVEGAATTVDAEVVAKQIAHSPLIKTALFASDPNLGRILMAIGNAPVASLKPQDVQVFLGGVQVIRNGERAADYTEAAGAAAVAPAEILIRVVIGSGAARATVWTCDFSYDYVKINAEYRT